MNDNIFKFLVRGPFRNKIIKALIFYSNEVLIYKQIKKIRLAERSLYGNKNLKNNESKYLKNTENCYPKVIIIKPNSLFINYLSLMQQNKKQFESTITKLFNDKYFAQNHNRKSIRSYWLEIDESFFKSPKKYLNEFSYIPKYMSVKNRKEYILEKHIIK